MIFSECQSHSHTPTLEEVTCPQCGEIVELFSTDPSAICENCGFTIYNNSLSCVQWCEHARECVGDEAYEHLIQLIGSEEDLL